MLAKAAWSRLDRSTLASQPVASARIESVICGQRGWQLTAYMVHLDQSNPRGLHDSVGGDSRATLACLEAIYSLLVHSFAHNLRSTELAYFLVDAERPLMYVGCSQSLQAMPSGSLHSR